MKRPPGILAVLVLFVAAGCGRGKEPESTAGHDEGWSVTAWGQRYEVFAETDPLVAGQPATSNAHVTVLRDFSPLDRGVVAVALRGGGGEQIYRQDASKRAGIFPVEITPSAAGTFDLVFLVDGPSGHEQIPAGRVRVGSAGPPGGREAEIEPTRPGFPSHRAATTTVSFLKEQQWRTEFATDWIVEGALHRSVSGPGRVAAAAGGETTLTAIVDATVAASPWPFPGLEVTAAKEVFRLVPRPSERGLPDLQADAVSLDADVEMTRSRVQRLTELLRVEATSAAELERAKATLAGLEARLQSARQGVSAVTGSSKPGDGVPVRTPWSGTIAEVFVSPGQTVVAGSPLARLVRIRPLWVILELRPEDAARVQGTVSGLILRRSGSEPVLEVPSGDLRLVSRSPELDSRTATVSVIVEARRGVPDLPIGSAVEAELLLGGEIRGVVVPVTSLVDDAGITVAYVQIEGESFERKELRIVERQGARALVEGLETGERLVTRGSAAIRRSALLSSGAPQGHVH